MDNVTVGDIVTINKEKYHIKAVSSFRRKVPNENYLFGLQVGIKVRRLSDGKVLNWGEMKGTYLGEKIEDWVYNCINGQRTFYWDWRKAKGGEIDV